MEVGGDRYHPCPDDLVDPLGGPTIYLTLDQDNPDLLREDGGSNRLEPKLPDQGVDRTRTNSLRQHNLNRTLYDAREDDPDAIDRRVAGYVSLWLTDLRPRRRCVSRLGKPDLDRLGSSDCALWFPQKREGME